MATPQIDIIFQHLVCMDEDDETDMSILEQEVSMLDDYELKVCLSTAKKYRKNYGFFYDTLKKEKDYRLK